MGSEMCIRDSCWGIYVLPGLSLADHAIITDYLISEFDSILSRFPDDKLIVTGDFNDLNLKFFNENFRLVDLVTEATRANAILDHIMIDESLCDFYPYSSTSQEFGPQLCDFVSSSSLIDHQ